MGKKDVLEKHLQGFNDVFADMVNVLLLSGSRRRVNPKDLTDAKARSMYKSGDGIHEQERDVSKLWKRGNIVFCFLGMENQTEPDGDMPVRVFGYDAADYRGQLARRDAEIRAAREAGDAERAKKLKEEKLYPVVTIILNYSLTRWSKAKNLLERVKVPRALAPYVNDYHIHVVDVAWLSAKQERMFKSDFRIVVEYFRQMRLNGKYRPSRRVIQHVDAVLKLMSELTGDRRFEEVQNSFRKGEKVTMVSALDEYVERGRKEGRATGLAEGRATGLAEGRAEGAQQAQEGFAERMLKAGKLALKEIAEYSGLTLAQVKAIQKNMM
ncbi:MAG: transposase [Synergistaceae bacterium]|nr:transposase [Synergistaceae bacterium]